MAQSLRNEYRAYLSRVEQRVGSLKIGAYTKYRGRLIKKLSFDEFADRYERYRKANSAFARMLAKGDTVNDSIVQIIDEHAAELLLDS